MTRRLTPLFLAIALIAVSCSDDASTDAVGTDGPTTSAGGEDVPAIEIDEDAGDLLSNRVEGQPQLALITVAEGLRSPVDMEVPPGDDRLFVLEVRHGTIVIIDDGTILEEPFLDISERLAANGEGPERGRGERGLLTIAFHPDYVDNGRFFIWYGDEGGDAELVEYRVSDDPDKADPDSAVVLRHYDVDKGDHFGGSLVFGPDGYLWLGVGDGGNRFNARNNQSARGGILRLDVSTPGVAVAAEGNPFIDVDGADEDLWATGLRNPWRWSLDAESGLIFVADVGREVTEELNVQPLDVGGLNYGWPTLEGDACFTVDDPVDDCDRTGLTDPDIVIAHPEVCSIIGGGVYRGAAINALDGVYFYSDFCGGFLRSFVYADGEITDEHQWFDELVSVQSFAFDLDGELYILSGDGFLRKLVSLG